MKNLLSKPKFHLVLGFSAFLIALCAAFFSVYGISTLFAGAALSVMIMASSLEIGKLVATTFLYRYWSKCSKLLRFYLTTSIVVLMVITSLGIFGYLSSAYQKSSIEFSVTQEKIKNTENQKVFYQDKIESSKKRTVDLTKLRASQENRMSDVLTNEFISRNPLQLKQLQQQTVDLISATDKDIKEENQKIQTSIEDIHKIDEQVNQLKLGSASKKDVQTFKFVADALGISLDAVARWFIVSIIFVFDPLAICLVLAYNVAVYRKEDETVYDSQPDKKTLIRDFEPPIITSEKQIITDAQVSQTETPPTESSTDHFFNSYFKK